jgi:hypothetical protein
MPANSATSKNKQAPTTKAWLKCGEVETYAELNKKRAKPKWERDHVPSHAAMFKAATGSPAGRGMTAAQKACVKGKIKDRALTIAIPKSLHRGYSRTCGSRNTASQIKKDAKNLKSATNKDLARLQKRLDSTGSPCAAAYREAARQVRAQDREGLIKKAIAECTS